MAYRFRCDKNDCGNIFQGTNPDSCPKCNSHDFTIIGEVKKSKLWLIILLILLFLGSVITALILWNPWSTGGGGGNGGGGQPVPLTFLKEDNYLEVTSHDVNVFKIVLENTETFKVVYSEDGKFYPCEDGEYQFKWTNTDEDSIKGSYTTDFTLTAAPHQNACEDQLDPSSLKINVDKSNCTYTVSCNLNSDEIEVSTNENGNFQISKIVWTKNEVSNASKLWVRKIGTEMVFSSDIKECEIKELGEINNNDIINAFESKCADIDNEELMLLLSEYTVTIIFRGNSMSLIEFDSELSTDELNGIDITQYVIRESDIWQDGNMVEIKISSSN